MKSRVVLLMAVVALHVPLRGACPEQAAVAAYVADFKAARVSKGFGNDLSLADAECARSKVAQELSQVLGPVVGYKAAFTNPETQKRMGVASPAWATMFARNMMQSGARVPAQFGAIPRYEADFIVVVKDAELARARTPLEALQHISAVVPFIELPDLMLEGKPSATAFIASNIAFRAGVLGPRIPVEPTQAFVDALADMTVVMTEDKSGKELGRVRGNVIMEHPLHAALWLAQALEKEGIALRPGDLLSLGNYIPFAPPQAGTSITVKYMGLPGDPAVTVHFE